MLTSNTNSLPNGGRLLYEPCADRPADERLLAALERYCTCEFNMQGMRAYVCPGHATLVNDPRWPLRLAFARSLVLRLTVEEWMVVS